MPSSEPGSIPSSKPSAVPSLQPSSEPSSMPMFGVTSAFNGDTSKWDTSKVTSFVSQRLELLIYSV
jgi:hypothetical protein